MSKQEVIFLISLGVSGLVIGWLASALCGLQYFLMNFLGPTLIPMGILLFLWWIFSHKTVQDVLTYGFILVIGLGIGASSAHTVSPVPQEICERN